MKTLWVTVLCLALTGCGGGFDSLPPKVSNGAGGTIGAGSTFPADKGDWKYGSVSNENGLLSLTARIDATNTYTVPKYPNLKQRSWIELEKTKTSNGGISKRFLIFSPEEVRCTPNCNIRIKFNGNTTTYSFLQKTDGVLTPASDQIASELFDKTAQANRATIYLPIVGLSNEFGSEFNLKGYDKNKMMFENER